MSSHPRPLSPHLQIYKPTLHMMMSISHRITGVALIVGTGLLLYWLGAAARGPQAYASASGLLTSWFGYVLLFGWSVALFYHLSNGVRHLIWDTGRGYEIKEIRQSGIVVLAVTAGLTGISWIIGLLI